MTKKKTRSKTKNEIPLMTLLFIFVGILIAIGLVTYLLNRENYQLNSILTLKGDNTIYGNDLTMKNATENKHPEIGIGRYVTINNRDRYVKKRIYNQTDKTLTIEFNHVISENEQQLVTAITLKSQINLGVISYKKLTFFDIKELLKTNKVTFLSESNFSKKYISLNFDNYDKSNGIYYFPNEVKKAYDETAYIESLKDIGRTTAGIGSALTWISPDVIGGRVSSGIRKFAKVLKETKKTGTVVDVANKKKKSLTMIQKMDKFNQKSASKGQLATLGLDPFTMLDPTGISSVILGGTRSLLSRNISKAEIVNRLKLSKAQIIKQNWFNPAANVSLSKDKHDYFMRKLIKDHMKSIEKMKFRSQPKYKDKNGLDLVLEAIKDKKIPYDMMMDFNYAVGTLTQPVGKRMFLSTLQILKWPSYMIRSKLNVFGRAATLRSTRPLDNIMITATITPLMTPVKNAFRKDIPTCPPTILGYIDPLMDEATNDCRHKRSIELEFIKQLQSFIKNYTIENYTIENYTTENYTTENIRKYVRLGTSQLDPEKRAGHIYGQETWGMMVDDEQNDKLKYPVNENVFIMSLSNVMAGLESNNDINDSFDTFLSSDGFKATFNNSCIWTIKRVKKLDTWDFDYLRGLDKSGVNRKSMDGMVYCIWNNKLQKYLMNRPSSKNGAMQFCKVFNPKSCGWIITRLPDAPNMYKIFSMGSYTYTNDDILNDVLSVVTLDPITPIVERVRKGSEFPYFREFVTPYFSSYSTRNKMVMEQFSSIMNSWVITPVAYKNGNDIILNPIIQELDSNLSNAEQVIDSMAEELYTYNKQDSRDLDYTNIRQICYKDKDCKNSSDGMYSKGTCADQQFCDVTSTGVGRCQDGRHYGEQCNVLKNLGGEDQADDCGDDLICRGVPLACRYENKKRKNSQTCGEGPECINYSFQNKEPVGCNGTESALRIGEGRCEKVDNGRAIHAPQIDCHNETLEGKRCKSGHACWGYCEKKDATRKQVAKTAKKVATTTATEVVQAVADVAGSGSALRSITHQYKKDAAKASGSPPPPPPRPRGRTILDACVIC